MTKNFINQDGFNSKKLQVILEFLFFIRDKTIDIIHLLNNAALFFFEYLNKFPSDKSELFKKNDDNIIINKIKDDNNDSYYIEELEKEFQFNHSSDHENLNKKISNNF